MGGNTPLNIRTSEFYSGKGHLPYQGFVFSATVPSLVHRACSWRSPFLLQKFMFVRMFERTCLQYSNT